MKDYKEYTLTWVPSKKVIGSKVLEGFVCLNTHINGSLYEAVEWLETEEHIPNSFINLWTSVKRAEKKAKVTLSNEPNN